MDGGTTTTICSDNDCSHKDENFNPKNLLNNLKKDIESTGELISNRYSSEHNYELDNQTTENKTEIVKNVDMIDTITNPIPKLNDIYNELNNLNLSIDTLPLPPPKKGGEKNSAKNIKHKKVIDYLKNPKISKLPIANTFKGKHTYKNVGPPPKKYKEIITKTNIENTINDDVPKIPKVIEDKIIDINDIDVDVDADDDVKKPENKDDGEIAFDQQKLIDVENFLKELLNKGYIDENLLQEINTSLAQIKETDKNRYKNLIEPTNTYLSLKKFIIEIIEKKYEENLPENNNENKIKILLSKGQFLTKKNDILNYNISSSRFVKRLDEVIQNNTANINYNSIDSKEMNNGLTDDDKKFLENYKRINTFRSFFLNKPNNKTLNNDTKKQAGGDPNSVDAVPLALALAIPPSEIKVNEFEEIVDLLEEKVKQIIFHPILIKIKSLKAEDLLYLSSNTTIYTDKNQTSFYPTKELIDIIMEFLFVDYTPLDVYKQIYYYYDKKINEENEKIRKKDGINLNNHGEDFGINVIKQKIYTHSGIMKIINVLLNKFTYVTYYNDFIQNDHSNIPPQSRIDNAGRLKEIEVSLLEKDTFFYYKVTQKKTDIQVSINNSGGMHGGEGNDEAISIALATSIEMNTPMQTDDNTNLTENMPNKRKYIYIKRFISLIREFTHLDLDDNYSNDYIQKMLNVMILNHIQNIGNVAEALRLMMNSYNYEFFEKLNSLVEIQNSKLITYVKINNFKNQTNNMYELLKNYTENNGISSRENIITKYNKRFEVYVNMPSIIKNFDIKNNRDKGDIIKTGLKTLMLKYNDDNFPYYKRMMNEKDDADVISNELKLIYDNNLDNKDMKYYVSEKDKDKFEITKSNFVDNIENVVKIEDYSYNDLAEFEKKYGLNEKSTVESNKYLEDKKITTIMTDTQLEQIIKECNSNIQYLTDLKKSDFYVRKENEKDKKKIELYINIITESIKNFEKRKRNNNFTDLVNKPSGVVGRVINNAATRLGFKKKIGGGKDELLLDKVNKYDSTFLFGRMNQIFLPYLPNKEVANHMENIIDKITDKNLNKKLFTIGYGASGTGKTSSLIYFNKGKEQEDKEGVIIHLCNKLGQMGYTKATVTTKEFFGFDNGKLDEYTGKAKEFVDYPHQKIKLEMREVKKANNMDSYYECEISRGPFHFTFGENRENKNVKEYLCDFEVEVDVSGNKLINKKNKTDIRLPDEVNTYYTEANLLKTGGGLIDLYKNNKSLEIPNVSENNRKTTSTEKNNATTTDMSNVQIPINVANYSIQFGNVHTYRTYDIDEKKNEKGIRSRYTMGYDKNKQEYGEYNVRFPNPQYIEEEIETKNGTTVKTKINFTDPDKPVNLGQLLIYLIDNDRFTKATTNNPNSSRSHILLFLKLEKDENKKCVVSKKDKVSGSTKNTLEDLADTVDIIIGDFAGVENEFNCEDAIPEFLTLERDIEPKYLYYKPDESNNVIDEVFGGAKDPVKDENLKFITDIRNGMFNALKTNNGMQVMNPFLARKPDLCKIFKFNESDTNKVEIDMDMDMFKNALIWIGKNYDNYNKLTKLYLEDKNDEAYQLLLEEKENVENEQFEILKEALKRLLKDSKIEYFRPKNGNGVNLDDSKTIIKHTKKISDYIKTKLGNTDTYVDEWFSSSKGNAAAVIELLEKYLNNAKLSRYFQFYGGAPTTDKLDDNDVEEYAIILPNDKLIENIKTFIYLENEIHKMIMSYYKRIIEINVGLKMVKEDYNFAQTIPDNYLQMLAADDGNIQAYFDLLNLINKQHKNNLPDERKKKYINDITGLKNINKTTSYNFTYTNHNVNTIFKNISDNLFNLPKLSSVNEIKGATKKIENIKNTIESIKPIIEKLHNYYQSGKKVCENRRAEGIFINDSLSELRKNIQEIMVYNSQDSIDVTPDFINDCMNAYCTGNRECFKMDQAIMNSEVIPSVLFKAIFDHYYKTPDTSDIIDGEYKEKDDIVRKALQKFFGAKQEKMKKEFYDELLVNIFCVFNISKVANNPPVVPYIDINNLKRNFNNQLYNKSQEYSKELMVELKKVLKQIAKYPTQLKDLHNTNDSVKFLANYYLGLQFPIPTIEDSNDNVNDNVDDKNKVKESPFSKGLSDEMYMQIDMSDQNNYEEEDTKQFPPNNHPNREIFERNVSDLIIAVDNTNASSVIGTLEFVDKMAKFGTVENLCTINNITLDDNREIKEEKKFKAIKDKLDLHEINNQHYIQSKYNNDKDAEVVDFFELLSHYENYFNKSNIKTEKLAVVKAFHNKPIKGGKISKTEKRRNYTPNHFTEKRKEKNGKKKYHTDRTLKRRI